jgi:hypothetical protein
LQEHERKLLADYLRGQSIKDIADAIDKLTSFENAYIIVTIIEIITGAEILPGTPNDIYKLIDYLRDWGKNKSPFVDPDGSRGWAGFWDVDLGEDWNRFREGLFG